MENVLYSNQKNSRGDKVLSPCPEPPEQRIREAARKSRKPFLAIIGVLLVALFMVIDYTVISDILTEAGVPSFSRDPIPGRITTQDIWVSVIFQSLVIVLLIDILPFFAGKVSAMRHDYCMRMFEEKKYKALRWIRIPLGLVIFGILGFYVAMNAILFAGGGVVGIGMLFWQQVFEGNFLMVPELQSLALEQGFDFFQVEMLEHNPIRAFQILIPLVTSIGAFLSGILFSQSNSEAVKSAVRNMEQEQREAEDYLKTADEKRKELIVMLASIYTAEEHGKLIGSITNKTEDEISDIIHDIIRGYIYKNKGAVTEIYANLLRSFEIMAEKVIADFIMKADPTYGAKTNLTEDDKKPLDEISGHGREVSQSRQIQVQSENKAENDNVNENEEESQ